MNTNPIYQKVEEVKDFPDFLDFTESNFTKLTSKFPSELLISESAKYFSNRVYEPDPKGYLPTREAIVGYYAKRGIVTDSNYIVITSSTSESYNLLFSLFTSPGDEILLPAPSYPLFSYFAELNKIDVKYYNLNFENDWRIDFDLLEKTITSKTKFVVLISPNNPTGQVTSQSDLDKLYKLLKKFDIPLIVDEVFSDLIYNFEGRSYTKIHFEQLPTIFVLNGISKLLALPDLKLAWIMVYAKGDKVAEIMEKLEIANDNFLNANYLIQSIFPQIYEKSEKFRQEIFEELKGKAQIINNALSSIPQIKLIPVQGGIHFVIGLPREAYAFGEEEFVLELLEKYHVLLHPGYFYDFENDNYLFFVGTIFQSDKIDRIVSAITKLLCK